MSWLARLAHELSRRGVVGRERRRIMFELQDHLACDPDSQARLGDPAELAASFAEQVATTRTRRAAFGVFAALASAALALAVSQIAIPHYPGYRNGHSMILFIPAVLGMLIAPQVALLAGTLAGARALRRRHAATLPAAELTLIRRRAWVGLGAGLATVAGIELYVANFSSILPPWWLLLVGGLAAFAGVALLAAAVGLVRAGSVASAIVGPAGDVFDDIPLLDSDWLRRRPWRLGVLTALALTGAMTLVEWHAERSLSEGLQRGLFEGTAAGIGLVVFGPVLGVIAGRQRRPPP